LANKVQDFPITREINDGTKILKTIWQQRDTMAQN